MATAAFITYGPFGDKNFSFVGSSGYPVPSVTIAREQQRDSVGRPIGATVNITLEGKIFTGSGVNGFNDVLTLESGLRNTFSRDGKTLTIGCGSLTTTYSGIKINRYNANRTDNNWTTTIDYTIDLQSEVSGTGTGIFLVSSTQDDWSIETIDEQAFAKGPSLMGAIGFGNNLSFDQGARYPLFRITRTLGAVGKYVPTIDGPISGQSPIKWAKEWVNHHLGLDPKFTGVISGLALFNFVRSINASDTEGSYRITDNWLGVPTGATENSPFAFIETFTIESSVDETMRRTVNVQGTIKGLEPFITGNIYSQVPYISGSLDNTLQPLYPNTRVNSIHGTKFANAISGYSGIKPLMYERANAMACTGINSTTTKWNFYGGNSNGQGGFSRAENSLNPIPASITEGMNPAEGTITYNWSFNNRPLNLISGSISETLTVDDSFAIPVIASIFVLGRKLGPILQDLGTITSSSRTVDLEVILPRPTSLRDIVFPVSYYNTITGIVESFNPAKLSDGTNAQGVVSFVKGNSNTWNINEGRFRINKSWEWTKCYT